MIFIKNSKYRAVFVLSALLFNQAVSAQLSKEAQADLKQQSIISVVKQGQFGQAHQQFEEYDAIGVAMPTSLLFIRAQVNFKQNYFVASKQYLEQYIDNAQRDTPNYSKALSMQQSVELKIQAKAKQAQSRIMAKVQALQESGISLLPEMVSIPAGSFQMGSSISRVSDEKPVQTISVKAFKLANTETTQQLWRAVMGSNLSSFKGSNRPFDNASWNSIQEFIEVLNRATGDTYRLPSEAEWEYAARAGSTTKYSWGDTASKSNANYYASPREGTKKVKSYKPNKWGLYDMHGNVWEWVQDCYFDSHTNCLLYTSPSPRDRG